MKTHKDIYDEVVGQCSLNQDYEKEIKTRVLKAMSVAVEQAYQTKINNKKSFFEKLKTLYQKYFVSNTIVSAEYIDDIMVVKYKRGNIEHYNGSCTVWHKLPFMKRCNSSTESWLCDLWTYNRKWNGPYPNAHKNPIWKI